MCPWLRIRSGAHHHWLSVSLQDSAESFQLFISRCSSHSVAPLDETLLEISVFREQQLSSLPKGLLQLYNQLTRHNIESIRGLGDATVNIMSLYLLYLCLRLSLLSASLVSSLCISSLSPYLLSLARGMLTKC